MRMEHPALVSLTFDDGLRCQFERAVPIMDRHGFVGTFFLVANTDPIHTDAHVHPNWHKTTWSEADQGFLRSMIRRGHEIGAHSVSHRRPELDDDPKGEAEKSKKWIEERLGVEIPSYCYPFYHLTEPIKKAVIGAGFQQARWGVNDSYYSYVERSEVDRFQVDCRQIGRHGQENVEEWLRPGCWHVLTYHGIGTLEDGWEPISVAEFTRQIEELARYRDAGEVRVLTFHDGAALVRREDKH